MGTVDGVLDDDEVELDDLDALGRELLLDDNDDLDYIDMVVDEVDELVVIEVVVELE